MSRREGSKKSLKQSQVAAFRLRRHHLWDDRPADLATISRDVCGIQAQVMSAAELALWARADGLARSEIHRALWERRTLVKTSSMRRTLHLLSSEDFPIFVRALESSSVRQVMQIMARYGVSEKEAHGVTEAAVAELASGPMRRRELNERVMAHGLVSKKGRRWFELGAWGVARLALVRGFICYGPDSGNEVSFVRVDQWLPHLKQISEAAAGREFLRRYLSAYGPATLRDFARWAGIAVPEAKAIWSSVEDELEEVDVEGRRAFILRGDREELFEDSTGHHVLRLLPNFDPYLLGHVEKDHVVSQSHYKKIYRQAAWISPVVLFDGRAVGTWSYARRRKRLQVKVSPFEKFSRAIRAMIEEKVAELGKFLGAPADVEVDN
jgi:uncharacterized protein YcaQ